MKLMALMLMLHSVNHFEYNYKTKIVRITPEQSPQPEYEGDIQSLS